ARLFTMSPLAEGEALRHGAGPGEERMVVVVSGLVRLEVTGLSGVVASTLEPGDRHGDISLLTGVARETKITARREAELATLDRAGLDAILAEFPAVALPLATELATELRAKNEVMRELLELHAEPLSKEQRAAAVEDRKRALAHRGARVTRLSPG